MKTNLPMFYLLLTLLIAWLVVRIFKRSAEKYFKKQEFIDLSRQTDDVTEMYEKIIERKARITNSFYSNFSPVIVEGKVSKVKDATNTYLCDESIYQNLKSINGIQYFFGFSNSPAIKQKATDIKNQLLDLNKSIVKLQDLKEEMLQTAKNKIPKWIMLFYKSQTMLMLGLQIDMSKLENNNFTYTIINQQTKQEMQIVIDDALLSNFAYKDKEQPEKYDVQTINDLLKSIGGPIND